MDDDFALIDFALVAASPERVALALGTAMDLVDAETDAAAPRPGLLSRLLRRAPAGGAAPGPLRIQPRSSVGPEPLVRHVLDDMGLGAAERLMRVSGPVGEQALTLVEFREGDGESSPICAKLSGVLRDVDVCYFRLSGRRHPGGHYAFHVYQNGLASRRAASMSRAGTAPEAPWEGVDAGIFHPVETDSLTPPGTPAHGIMTPDRVASILEAMGVAPETLFERIADRPDVLVLSPAAEGSPLSEASMHLGPRLRGPAGFAPPRAPVPGSAPMGAAAASPALPAGAGDDPAAMWEREVTGLLIRAVEAGLPEADQVPWLSALTMRLEAGELSGALAEAQALIARAQAPAEERAQMSERLAELFRPAMARAVEAEAPEPEPEPEPISSGEDGGWAEEEPHGPPSDAGPADWQDAEAPEDEWQETDDPAGEATQESWQDTEPHDARMQAADAPADDWRETDDPGSEATEESWQDPEPEDTGIQATEAPDDAWRETDGPGGEAAEESWRAPGPEDGETQAADAPDHDWRADEWRDGTWRDTPDVPETGVPETSVPETGVPETGRPEAGAPDQDRPERPAPHDAARGEGEEREGGEGDEREGSGGRAPEWARGAGPHRDGSEGGPW